MGSLLFAIILWMIGIGMIGAGRILAFKMKAYQEDLKFRADDLKMKNQTAFFELAISEKVLDIIPWYAVRIVSVIIGLIFIALGAIAFSFYII